MQHELFFFAVETVSVSGFVSKWSSQYCLRTAVCSVQGLIYFSKQCSVHVDRMISSCSLEGLFEKGKSGELLQPSPESLQIIKKMLGLFPDKLI